MDAAAQDLELVFDPLPGEALTRLVTENVINLNFARTGVSDWHPVGFFLRSARGEWLGGLTGYIWGGWLHVNFLWVSESFRGQRQGTRLMDAAEAMAKERGAVAATLETFTFQAPEFYWKRGYAVVGQLDHYPPGHSKFFLSKRLID
jgi:ribosomal protein S18 acetylase RimI-like enzyme